MKMEISLILAQTEAKLIQSKVKTTGMQRKTHSLQFKDVPPLF